MQRYFHLLMLLLITSSCGEEPVLHTFGSISGIVQDARTNSPLSGVSVSITPLGYAQVTGSDGLFIFDNLEVQEYTLVYSKDGYQTEQRKVSVKPGITSSAHVSLTPMAGSFVVTPTELNFGDTETSLMIQVRNLSGMATAFTAESSNGWLSVSPTTGSVTQSDYLTAIVSREGLSPGEYTGEIRIKYVGENLSVPVRMNVTALLAPVVTIESVSSVSSTSATILANLTSTGSTSVTQMGVCWSSENTVPTLSDHVTNQGDASAPCSFSAVLGNLSPGTTYYCRAYAKNSIGISYSERTLSFTTTSSDTPDPGPGPGGDDVSGGLLLYYSFDNEDVLDQTRYQLDGRIVNGATFEDDSPSGSGKALFLNSVKNQYISIDYNVLKGLQEYSISMWLKDFQPGLWIAGIKASSNEEDCPIVFWEGDDNLYYDSFGINAFHGGMSPPRLKYSFTSIQNQWHHFVITCKKVNDYHHIRDLFVDTLHVDSNEYTVDSYRISSTEPYKFVIGGDGDGRYSRPGSFVIDNFRIYTNVLSEDVIQQLFDKRL
ncbi:MAG: carboxypeptidase-like regulatory domain-containing protein [Bacteroidales bacterium]|nr:carboxypeptidase-like regulatory domain-containing protein [Bacteroidales bacterium]